MKIKFLGTAAAEGWPALFCECEACLKARKSGGRNIRTRSSCVIDDVYMVDFPPDTYMHVLNNNLVLSSIKYLIITHSHEDHFYPQDIHMRKEPYAHIHSNDPLFIYGNSKVKKGFDYTNAEIDGEGRLIFQEVYPYIQFKAGKAQVTPLLANHTQGEQCYIYLVNLGGKVLLYGHDTGYFPEQTWEVLKGTPIDIALFDCTDGAGKCTDYHMGFPAVLRVKDRLVQQGCTSDHTLYVITHFSHNGKLLHDELVSIAHPYGFITAFDGMELNV